MASARPHSRRTATSALPARRRLRRRPARKPAREVAAGPDRPRAPDRRLLRPPPHERRAHAALAAPAPGGDATQSCTIELQRGRSAENGKLHVINGPDVKSTNTVANPDAIGVRIRSVASGGTDVTLELEPHSRTALVIDVA